MAIVRISELRSLDDKGLKKKLLEVQTEYMTEKGKMKAGGRAPSPGKVQELRKIIARIKTLQNERVKGITREVVKTNKK